VRGPAQKANREQDESERGNGGTCLDNFRKKVGPVIVGPAQYNMPPYIKVRPLG
jgi:hypothetical protein